jgi:hypothetical protein
MTQRIAVPPAAPHAPNIRAFSGERWSKETNKNAIVIQREMNQRGRDFIVTLREAATGTIMALFSEMRISQ